MTAQTAPRKSVQPFDTVKAADLSAKTAPLAWLADGLFLKAGAGILGGSPKSCLCRARHKQHYAASGIMSRASVCLPPLRA
jgi:hypothetical protein